MKHLKTKVIEIPTDSRMTILGRVLISLGIAVALFAYQRAEGAGEFHSDAATYSETIHTTCMQINNDAEICPIATEMTVICTRELINTGKIEGFPVDGKVGNHISLADQQTYLDCARREATRLIDLKYGGR